MHYVFYDLLHLQDEGIQNRLKVAFFQKVRFVFQISKKNYSKSLSWAWNLNKLFTVMGGKFKCQVQDNDLIWQCRKQIAFSENKPPLYGAKVELYLGLYSWDAFEIEKISHKLSNFIFNERAYFFLSQNKTVLMKRWKDNPQFIPIIKQCLFKISILNLVHILCV